jgi:hypothetical protein
MPEISRFFGIIITMYYLEELTEHYQPHFHARCQNFHAVFLLGTLEIVRGRLPDRERRLVEAWAELHRSELEHNWDLLQTGKPPTRIDPLRR